MAKLYLDERRLREIGFDEPMIVTFRTLTDFVNTQNELAAAQADIATAQADLTTQEGQLTAAEASIETLTAESNSQDARLDALEAAGPYVVEGQEAAPSYSTFAGQTITDPPTQAEVQAIDDGLAAASTALDSVITKLQSASVFS